MTAASLGASLAAADSDAASLGAADAGASLADAAVAAPPPHAATTIVSPARSASVRPVTVLLPWVMSW